MQSAGTLSSQVAIRVRDKFFTATSQPNTISLLSYAQQVINGVLGDVIQSAPLIHQPRTTIYQISSFLPSAIKIVGIRDAGGRDLEPIAFQDLSALDFKWITSIADFPRGFATAGRDILCIWPGVKTAQTLSVLYSQLTPALATTADSTIVPNEDDDAILDLTEVLLLVKNRDLLGVKEAMDRMKGRLQELKVERR